MITIDTWLYGELAKFGDKSADRGFSNQRVQLPPGSAMQHLLDALEMPSEARGITFINGNLSAMPGIQPDLEYVLQDKDRVAFFHLRAMWPYQYRQGAAIFDKLENAIQGDEDKGVHHSYEKKSD